jgi:hypothetical protein
VRDIIALKQSWRAGIKRPADQKEALMKNVMKYAALFALSAAVVMACSAEVYAAHAGHEPAPVVVTGIPAAYPSLC